MKSLRPVDLEVIYSWSAASVPPPGHYEFTIRIGPGCKGELRYTPDYPGEGVPTWMDTFKAGETDLDALYRALSVLRVTRRRWRELERPPVGDETSSLRIQLGGATYFIHSQMQQYELLAPVCEQMTALVPASVWAQMNSQRASYIGELYG